MDAYKATLMPLGLIAAVGLGYLAGHFLEKSELPPEPVNTTTRAMTLPPPAPAAPKALAHAPPAPDPAKEARLADIDYELAELPADNAEALKALSEQIRQEQERIAGLRAQLRQSDRALLLEAASAGADPARAGQLDFELEKAELGSELVSAKIAVKEQEWFLNHIFAGSDNTKEIRELKAELGRRRARVSDLEGRITALTAANRQGLDAGSAQRAARIQRWREERAALEAAYADSLGALSIRNQAYQRLAQESSLARRRAEQLREERKALAREGRDLSP